MQHFRSAARRATVWHTARGAQRCLSAARCYSSDAASAAAAQTTHTSAATPAQHTSSDAARGSHEIVRTVATRVLPPPAPRLTESEKRASVSLAFRTGWKAMLRQANRDLQESVQRKTEDPVGVIQEQYGPLWRALRDRWLARWRYNFQDKPRPPRMDVYSFSADTDLSTFTLLNDNNFGGSSTSSLELRERTHVDPTTGEQRRTYSVVWKGELRQLMPFQERHLNVLKKVNTNTNQPQTSAPTQPTPAPKLPASPPPPSTSRTPPSPSMRSSPPPAPGAQSASADNSRSDATSAALAPDAASPAPASPADPSNPFLQPQESSREAFFRAQRLQAQQGTVSSPDAPVAAASTPPKRHNESAMALLGFGNERSAPVKETSRAIDGFAALILPVFPWPGINLEHMDYLAVRIRTDGRAYMFNARCAAGVLMSKGEYIYQARIVAERPRPMHKLEVKIEGLMASLQGRIPMFPPRMPRDRVESFGFSIMGPPGPFELELECISAHTGMPDYERQERDSMMLEHRQQTGATNATTPAPAPPLPVDPRLQVEVAHEIAKLRRQARQGFNG